MSRLLVRCDLCAALNRGRSRTWASGDGELADAFTDALRQHHADAHGHGERERPTLVATRDGVVHIPATEQVPACPDSCVICTGRGRSVFEESAHVAIA